jgi:hypothetical protein
MVTIGITTYNRANILEIMAKSLYKSDLSVPHNIRIYDDQSTEYGIYFLEKLFPTAKSIRINRHNLKADKNMYQMYADFISTGDDYFFNADSDIIFNNRWLNAAMELIAKTEGVLSLFNANSHEPYKIVNDTLCLKNTVGAAGTFFSRNRLAELMNRFDSIEQVKGFDWQWSEYFRNNNIKIYCVNKSLVQHIGYDGQNTGLYFDVGKDYKIETVEDGQIMNDIFEKSLDAIMLREKEKEEETAAKDRINEEHMNDFNYCFKRCVIIIIKKILPKIIVNKLRGILVGGKKNGA